MYEVKFTHEAKKQIQKLPPRIQVQVKNRLLWLAENCTSVNHQKLKGDFFENIYKLRIGDYRILYSLNKREKIIVVELAGNRKDIYKN